MCVRLWKWKYMDSSIYINTQHNLSIYTLKTGNILYSQTKNGYVLWHRCSQTQNFSWGGPSPCVGNQAQVKSKKYRKDILDNMSWTFFQNWWKSNGFLSCSHFTILTFPLICLPQMESTSNTKQEEHNIFLHTGIINEITKYPK